MEKEIIEAFGETGSIKSTEKITGYSWQRVVKVLSTNGIIANENHAEIMRMYENGATAEKIAQTLSLNVKTVKAYLPAQRPYYGVNQTKKAIALKQWRDKKKEQNIHPQQ